MTRILHLSDMHFGDGHHFPQGDALRGSRSTLAGAIANALERESLTAIDQLVISGDLLNDNQPGDQPHAKDGLQELTEKLQIEPERVLCVPGNHDLTWNPQWRERRFRFYDELLQSTGVVGLTTDMPHVVAPPPGKDGGRPLAFVLLNSCRIENQKLAGLGEIGQEALEKIGHRLDDAGVSAETHTLIAVLHHHLLPIVAHEESLYDEHGNDEKVQRPSLLMDAVRALHRFAEVGVSLVLHGHQHQSAVLRYEDVLHSSLPIGILAAGSCGTSALNVRRHFFVIDVNEARAEIRSFDQDHDPDRFAVGKTVVLTLPATYGSALKPSMEAVQAWQGESMPLPMLNGYCAADFQGRNVNVSIEPIEDDSEDPTDDSSDLCVIMFSVADCPTAREVVRQALRQFPRERSWKRLGEPQLSLQGMYDLLGNWDLALRLRISNGTSPTKIARYLDKQLQDANQRKVKGHFSEMSVLDVDREANSIREILTPGPTPVERRMLGDTEDYDRLRCQRSFVWIELGVDRDKVLLELAQAIDQVPEVSAIVESANLDDQVLLLETFSACGQSSEIARLNRLIEPVLANWERQKYTLTCYGYDEDRLKVAEPQPA